MAPPSRSTLTSRAADSVKGAGEFLASPTYVSLSQAKDAIRSAVDALQWVVTNCKESKSAYPTRPDIREAILSGGDKTHTELKTLTSLQLTLASIDHPEDVPSGISRDLFTCSARLRQIIFVPPPKPRAGV